MLILFKMLDGRDVAINPKNVTEVFGGNSTTRVSFIDGSYTDIECSFNETVRKLNEGEDNGIGYLIDAISRR